MAAPAWSAPASSDDLRTLANAAFVVGEGPDAVYAQIVIRASDGVILSVDALSDYGYRPENPAAARLLGRTVEEVDA